MRTTSRWFGAACSAALMVLAAPAFADDVGDWITLVEKQPAGVDRAAWKEQRRDAARKLAAAKDKRALAVFLQLAERETFDIIGEIAIEGLGALGDPQAAPTLEKIAADASRDRTQRDLAKKALAKLGARPTKPPPPPPPPPVETATPPPPPPPVRTADADPAPVPTDVGQALLGDGNSAAPVAIVTPTFGDDVLAASESVTLAAGVASLGYDTVRDRLTFDADVAGRYRRRLERERMAWGVDGGARVIAATLDPDGPVRSRALIVDLDATAEARFYAGTKIYGLGTAALATQMQYLGIERETEPATRDARFATDVQIGSGGG